MKKKILKTGIIAMLIILLTQLTVFATWTVSFKTLTDKDSYTIGDKITVRVDWTDKAQSAGFDIQYDAEKLTFESANIDSGNYNSATEGILSVNWASLNEIDFTKMEFIFVAKAAGKTTISVENGREFGTGDLVPADDYNYSLGSKEITIKDNSNTNKVDTKQYISFPFVIMNGKSSVSLKSGVYEGDYTMYYQFVEVSDEVFNKLNDLNEKYKNNKITYEEYFVQYKDTVTKYNDSNWIKTEDGSFAMDLNKFTGTKKFTLWIKLVMTDKTVYETEIYTINGSGTATNNTQEQDTVNDKNTNPTVNTTTNKDNTTASGKMIYTGTETTILFVIGTVASIGIIVFKKYKNLSDI